MQFKNKNVITILTFVLIMLTSFAYSSLATNLAITGEAMFRTSADVRVSNITLDEASGATNEYEPRFTKDTITSGFTLNDSSSSISYTVRITNSGLRDQAIYNLITQSSNNSGLSILIDGVPINQALPIIVPYQDYRDITITYSSTSPGRVDVVNRFDFREVYYISYNTKGGSSVATQTKYKNVDLTLAGTPTKSGYRFLGWTDEQNGEVVKFEPGDTYTIDGDNKILYAIYELNVAEITLSGNVGGTEKIYQKYNDGFYLTNNNGTLSNKMTTSSNPITVPQKDGYKFEGYYTQANGQGTKFIESNGKLSSTASSTQFNANGSLYAYYTPYKLTINYYANGAQKDNGTTINNQKLTTDTYDYDGTDLASTGLKNYDGGTGATWNLTKTGYTASKYYHIGSANNSTKVHENTNYAKIQDLATAMNKGEDLKTSDVEVNVYAGWTANTYQVSFNANGGTGTMSNQSFTYDEALKALTTNAFTRAGYTFTGWNTQSNGQGDAYLDEEQVQNLTSTNNGVVTLYAQWIKELAFNNQTLNTGTYGNNYTSNAFTGASDGTGSYTYNIQSGAPVGATINSTNRTISFTNSTSVGTYNVVVRATDNSTGVYKDATMTIVINKATPVITLSSNSGTVYSGLTNSVTATVKSGNNSTVSGTLTATSLLSSVATVSPASTNITNADNSTGVGTSHTITGVAGGLTYINFNFTPSDTTNYNSAEVVQYTVTGKNKVTITLKKDGNNYSDSGMKVALYLQGEEIKSTTVNSGYTAEFNDINCPIACDIYAGRNSSSKTSLVDTGENISVYEGAAGPAGWTTPNASATINYNTLTLNKDSNITTVTGAGIYLSNQTATISASGFASNYTFNNWTKTTGNNPASATSSTTTVSMSQTTTLQANAKLVDRIVTFNANGGTGTMSNQSIPHGVSTALNANTYTKEGYIFVGWNTQANGLGTSYSDEEAITITSNTTLYAQWYDVWVVDIYYDNTLTSIPCEDVQCALDYIAAKLHGNLYTITFDANGGTGTMSPQTEVKPGDKLNKNTFTREGYKFIGWNTAADGTGNAYLDEESVVMAGNITLYAQWLDTSYTSVVTYNANGGTFTNDIKKRQIGYKVTQMEGTKYSHTQNLDDTGATTSENFGQGAGKYGNSWTNSNIRGTDRTSASSEAHVVTITGATSLHVSITYSGEGCCDWVAMWEGSHTDYTAASNYSTSITGQLYSSSRTTKEYTVSGDTVTFAYKSDGSVVGDGYGYYAVVTAGPVVTPNKTYEEPTRSGYTFEGWFTDKNYSMPYDLDSNNIPDPIPTEDAVVYAKWSSNTVPICRRASTLHTETCNQNSTSSHCGAVEGYNQPIVYGKFGTNNTTFTTGDAFDCDVNGNGTYDQRFYYVSDYFDTDKQETNSNYATLIYYSNVIEGVASTSIVIYDSNNTNYNGPRTAASHLPTTTQWSNINLYKTNRQILTQTNTTSTSGGSLPVYDYSNYAARLLTYQEVYAGCYNTSTSLTSTGGLNNCNFLMEETKYAKSSPATYGPWLETPYGSNSYYVYTVLDSDRKLGIYSANYTLSGVRPVIDVFKNSLDLTVNKYLVKFDSNTSDILNTYSTVSVGDSISTFATLTRTGYVFEGWYTDKTGGTQVTAPYTPTASITLYAHWRNIKDTEIQYSNTNTGVDCTTVKCVIDKLGELYY